MTLFCPQSCFFNLHIHEYINTYLYGTSGKDWVTYNIMNMEGCEYTSNKIITVDYRISINTL